MFFPILEYRKTLILGFKARERHTGVSLKNSALENSRTTVINMALPFDTKNPDSALASIKISNSIFLSQNNDLMDLVVVAEHNDTVKKNHQKVIEDSAHIDLEEEE